MFLRFTVSELHPQSHTWKGLFKAVGELQDGGRLSQPEHAALEVELEWFNERLPNPTCFGRPGSQRGVCWFTPEAGMLVNRMWRLAALVEAKGAIVRLHKTRDPGMRLYRDAYQVVAVPQGRPRWRVTC